MSKLVKMFLPVLLLGLLAGLCHASPLTICTENVLTGCRATIPTSVPALYVFSDGNVPVDPYGFGVPVGDAVELNASWVPDPAYAASFAAGYWTQIPQTYTWVLPASLPCGVNCDPIGKWIYPAGIGWNEGTPDFLVILEPDGIGWSDVIIVDNSGPLGGAAITFASDGAVALVPEPGTLALLSLGIVAFGLRRIRR